MFPGKPAVFFLLIARASNGNVDEQGDE